MLKVMPPEPTPTELINAIVDLHAAVSAGFARVDARFELFDERLGRVEGLEPRMARIEASLTSIKGEVAGLQRWMLRSDERFAALELHIGR